MSSHHHWNSDFLAALRDSLVAKRSPSPADRRDADVAIALAHPEWVGGRSSDLAAALAPPVAWARRKTGAWCRGCLPPHSSQLAVAASCCWRDKRVPGNSTDQFCYSISAPRRDEGGRGGWAWWPAGRRGRDQSRRAPRAEDAKHLRCLAVELGDEFVSGLVLRIGPGSTSWPTGSSLRRSRPSGAEPVTRGHGDCSSHERRTSQARYRPGAAKKTATSAGRARDDEQADDDEQGQRPAGSRRRLAGQLLIDSSPVNPVAACTTMPYSRSAFGHRFHQPGPPEFQFPRRVERLLDRRAGRGAATQHDNGGATRSESGRRSPPAPAAG